MTNRNVTLECIIFAGLFLGGLAGGLGLHAIGQRVAKQQQLHEGWTVLTRLVCVLVGGLVGFRVTAMLLTQSGILDGNPPSTDE